MRVVLPCGAEANVSENVSAETLNALDEMMRLVSERYAEKTEKWRERSIANIDCGSAEPEAGS